MRKLIDSLKQAFSIVTKLKSPEFDHWKLAQWSSLSKTNKKMTKRMEAFYFSFLCGCNMTDSSWIAVVRLLDQPWNFILAFELSRWILLNVTLILFKNLVCLLA